MVYRNYDPQKVIDWKVTNQEKLQRALEDQETVVLCEDEMHLSSKTSSQKVWLPANKYPKILISNKKEARSIYGFLNIKTGSEHAFKTPWQNMHITAEVLGKLRNLYPKKKLLLLWDGAGSHRGHKAQEFIKNDGNMESLYFPPYSPEENPQEHVWKEGRKEVTHNKYIEDIDVTTDAFVTYLNTTKFNYVLPALKNMLSF